MSPRLKVGLAGVALIVAVNAIAIGGALHNRTGEPGATLALSDRELALPYYWGEERDNSGLSLRLEWRVTTPGEYTRFSHGRETAWLDAARLAALGFDTALPADDLDAERHYARQLARDALLVLELDGPAYAAALAAAQARFEKEKAEDLAQAQRDLDYERERASRLFIVDAGTDRQALRARYPDTGRYAIVRGHVEIDVCTTRGGKRLCGHVGGVEADRINVPVEWRGVFEGLKWGNRFDRDAPRVAWAATVAFGRRLEPWLVSAQRTTTPPK
jgi:hypothetical protein